MFINDVYEGRINTCVISVVDNVPTVDSGRIGQVPDRRHHTSCDIYGAVLRSREIMLGVILRRTCGGEKSSVLDNSLRVSQRTHRYVDSSWRLCLM